MPDRTAGSFGLAANGSLTVVSLDTGANELIKLVAGADDTGNTKSDLVVVSPINVGRVGTGRVDLQASGGVTLGGTVTAAVLDVEVGGSLSLNSDVGTMKVVMTRPGDLTVVQAGALNLTELVILGGGNVAIEADGAITIGSITGVAGDITLTSKTGGISIASLAAGGNVVLSAVAGAISLGSAGNTVEMDSLSVVAKDAISIYEADGLRIDRLQSTDGDAVMVQAGGKLVVDGAITALGASTIVLRTTAGALELNQTLRSGSGAITLQSASHMVMDTTGDVLSTSGAITLTSGGRLDMTGETEINAGSGVLSLSAAGDIKLGKLRTTNAALLTAIDPKDPTGAVVKAGAAGAAKDEPIPTTERWAKQS
jgi:hypothetical protein